MLTTAYERGSAIGREALPEARVDATAVSLRGVLGDIDLWPAVTDAMGQKIVKAIGDELEALVGQLQDRSILASRRRRSRLTSTSGPRASDLP